MPRWDFERATELLDEFAPEADPADPKARKRLRIVRAATELLSERGYRRTTVDDVAEAAGVAKGTVYLYFKTTSLRVMSEA